MTTTSTIRRRALRTLGRHGDDLHAVATMLTADQEMVERLVVGAVAAAVPGTTDDLRHLSAHVVRSWLEGHPERIDVIPSAGHSVLDLVHELPARQRASLALCRFGDHTYRQAAQVLGMPDVTVAELLSASLRTVHGPTRAPADVDVDVTERPAV